MKKTERLERRMRDADNGYLRETLELYRSEIRRERNRMLASRNGFIIRCCKQEIEQLTAEMNFIDENAD